MGISKIEHIGIAVRDLDRSIKFYTEILGMKLVERVDNPGLQIGFLQIGDSQLELLRHQEAPEGYGTDGTLAHLAFTVDDIDAVVEKLKANNVNCMYDAPREVLGGCRIFFFKGPDNETLEIFQPRA